VDGKRDVWLTRDGVTEEREGRKKRRKRGKGKRKAEAALWKIKKA
jgi:hypothetical protein